jgi:hypothetical protein
MVDEAFGQQSINTHFQSTVEDNLNQLKIEINTLQENILAFKTQHAYIHLIKYQFQIERALVDEQAKLRLSCNNFKECLLKFKGNIGFFDAVLLKRIIEICNENQLQDASSCILFLNQMNSAIYQYQVDQGDTRKGALVIKALKNALPENLSIERDKVLTASKQSETFTRLQNFYEQQGNIFSQIKPTPPLPPSSHKISRRRAQQSLPAATLTKEGMPKPLSFFDKYGSYLCGLLSIIGGTGMIILSGLLLGTGVGLPLALPLAIAGFGAVKAGDYMINKNYVANDEYARLMSERQNNIVNEQLENGSKSQLNANNTELHRRLSAPSCLKKEPMNSTNLIQSVPDLGTDKTSSFSKKLSTRVSQSKLYANPEETPKIPIPSSNVESNKQYQLSRSL